MSFDHDRLSDRIPAYVLGALEGAELEELEQHLATECATCNAELLRSTRDLEALAAANAPVTPSEMTRARVMAEIESRSELSDGSVEEALRPPPEASGVAWMPLAAAASLLLLAWSGWSQVQLRREVQALQAQSVVDGQQLAAIRGELDQAHQQLGRFSMASRILATPGLETVRLAGLEAAPEASAQALVTADATRAVLYVSNLAPVGADQTYQLWVIAGGEPVPNGLFTVDQNGNASVVLEKLVARAPIEAWAVTIEPAGGVPQPTGPMVLMGAAV